jgi:hypothetical protein
MAGNLKKQDGHALLRFPFPQRLDGVQQRDREKKLRRRVEDRLRKDRQALFLVAKVLDIE